MQHPIASPVWSFDGTRIAWAEASGGGQHEIWAANADGTNQHRIAPGIDSLFEFAWLPSGDFLYDANYRLFRVGSDGHPRPFGSGVTFSVDRKGALVAYQTAELLPDLPRADRGAVALVGQDLADCGRPGRTSSPRSRPTGRSVAFTRFLSSGKGRYREAGRDLDRSVARRRAGAAHEDGHLPAVVSGRPAAHICRSRPAST